MKHLKIFEWNTMSSVLDELLHLKYDKQWVARIKRNLFASSEENHDIEKALSEWAYTGDAVVQPKSICNICNQPELVYIFKIRNMKNDNILWIGSDCIRRFTLEDTKSISVFDINGERIYDESILDRILKDDLKSLIKDAKFIRVLNILDELYKNSEDVYYNHLYDQYSNQGKFTPRQIVWLDNEMQKSKISYNPYDFVVDVSNPFYKIGRAHV